MVLLLIFIFENSQTVQVKFIFASTSTPLIFALLISAVLGMAVGLLLPRLRRPRKPQG